MGNYKDFRAILKDAVKDQLKDNMVGLLFSGGTDSLTVLWALLDLGIEVRCYTFRLEQVVSTDSKVAREAAALWGVPLEMVIIPYQTTSDLAQEMQLHIKKIKSYRKTHVECSWPFSYIVPHIQEQQVFTGLNADDLWGSSKSMAIKYAKKPREFKAERQRLMGIPSTSGWSLIKEIIGPGLVSPYRHSRVIEYLLGFSWKELNRPKQKMPAVMAFLEEFKRAPLYRKNDNLQCGSGIREYMARMLQDPTVNRKHSKSMRGLYRGFLNA